MYGTKIGRRVQKERSEDVNVTYINVIEHKCVFMVLEKGAIVCGSEFSNLRRNVLCVIVMVINFFGRRGRLIMVIMFALLTLFTANYSFPDMRTHVEFVLAKIIPDFDSSVTAREFVKGYFEIDIQLGFRIGVKYKMCFRLTCKVGPCLKKQHETYQCGECYGQKTATTTCLGKIDRNLAKKVDTGQLHRLSHYCERAVAGWVWKACPKHRCIQMRNVSKIIEIKDIPYNLRRRASLLGKLCGNFKCTSF